MIGKNCNKFKNIRGIFYPLVYNKPVTQQGDRRHAIALFSPKVMPNDRWRYKQEYIVHSRILLIDHYV